MSTVVLYGTGSDGRIIPVRVAADGSILVTIVAGSPLAAGEVIGLRLATADDLPVVQPAVPTEKAKL